MTDQPEVSGHTKAGTSPAPYFSRRQLWNMNCGFLGIEFGWSLQMTNMSAIFEHLGAHAHQLPLLWLAAPVTGLIVQPIIGNLSDRTWGPLGRRRPYFLAGAIVASLALVLMPQVTSLWMAVGLLWLLDTSANVSMEPFRAFVGDLLPQAQRTKGFATQSLMIGTGAVSAAILPWLLRQGLGIDHLSTAAHRVPLTVEFSFYLGALVFLVTVVWTVITTPESPPDPKRLAALAAHQTGPLTLLKETGEALGQMPPKMRQLARVQFFTWLGIFCFFLYFPPAVARNIFHASEQGSELYSAGIEWAGVCFAVFNGVCVAFSFGLPLLARRWGRPVTHGLCLLIGGLSLMLILEVHHPYGLLFTMVGFGLAWASILSMPYAMLVEELPAQRRGLYMGIFNFFIVLPQICVALGFGWIMQHLLHNNRLMAVGLGGVFLLVAAGFTLLIQSPERSSVIHRSSAAAEPAAP